MRIYVASSWRNHQQQNVVCMLREAGHDVYDFRRPFNGGDGFHWSEIDPAWQGWTPFEFIDGLKHELAEEGFASDFDAMRWAEACVLVLPCGRSAHLEAGWFIGQGKPCWIMLEDAASRTQRLEPELMYKMACVVVGSRGVLDAVTAAEVRDGKAARDRVCEDCVELRERIATLEQAANNAYHFIKNLRVPQDNFQAAIQINGGRCVLDQLEKAKH